MTNSALITNLDTAPDIDLVAAVALQTDDKETALAALKTLHSRYASWCLGIARFQDYSGIDPDMVVSKSFLAVWKAAGKFDPNKRREGVSLENVVKAWIFRILKNEIISEIRERAALAEVALLDGFEVGDENDGDMCDAGGEGAVDAAGDDQFSAPENQNGVQEDEATQKPLPGRMDMLKKLMMLLPEKDRLILDLSASYIEPNPPFRCLIPKDQLGCLATQIGVAPSSVKVLRERAYKKLRKLAETHNTTS